MADAMGHPRIRLGLSESERNTLENWVRARQTPAADKLRAQISLAWSNGGFGAHTAPYPNAPVIDFQNLWLAKVPL